MSTGKEMSSLGQRALLRDTPDSAGGNADAEPCISSVTMSLSIVMLWTFTTVTTMLIALPTCEQYMVHVAGPDGHQLAGLMIGIQPLAAAAVQLGVTWLLLNKGMKNILMTFACVLILGQSLYALAGVLHSPVALFAGRALAGMVSGPQALTAYIVKAIPPQRRSAVMLRVGLCVSTGYTVGVALGGLLDLWPSHHEVGTAAAAYNGESLPGWVIVCFAIIDLLLLIFFFENPPKPQLPPAPPGDPPPFPYKQLGVCFLVAFIIPVNIAAWEVGTTLETQNKWGWTPGQSALFVGLALVTVVPMNFVNFAALYTERQGMLCFLGAACLAFILFFGVDLPIIPPHNCTPPCTDPSAFAGDTGGHEILGGYDLRVGIYGIGMTIFVNGLQIGRQFTWALIAKLAPMKQRPWVLGFNAMIYMLGRGVGASVSNFFPSLVVHCAVLLSVTAVVWIILAYAINADILPPPPQAALPLPGPTAAGPGPTAAAPAGAVGSTVPSVRFTKETESRRPKAYVLGTGSAFGQTYSTEQMLTAFAAQRARDGDTECDLAFAERVFKACGFDGHSCTLPLDEVFRTFSRSEYLHHRSTSLVSLAAEAAEAALAHWGGDRSRITHLCWGTMTGAMHSPTIDIELATRLGLDPDVERTSIEGMGCLTGFRLLNIGRQLALASPGSRILVVSADLRSALGNAMPQKAQRADIVSVALFRDGASACVLGDGGVHADETAHYEVITGRSRIVPDTRGLVDYQEEDGGSIHLHIDKKLPDAIGRAEPAFVETLLHEAELLGHQPPDIEGFDVACHTGGPRVLHEVASALGAADEQLASSWAVMKARGNLSGASNLAVLDHLNRATAESARPLDVYAQRALPTF